MRGHPPLGVQPRWHFKHAHCAPFAPLRGNTLGVKIGLFICRHEYETPIETYRELVPGYGEGVTNKGKRVHELEQGRVYVSDKHTNERPTDRPAIELLEGLGWDVLTYSHYTA